MNHQAAGKKNAAEHALTFIQPEMIIGVGTGSTVRYFIEALGIYKQKIEGAIASSKSTEHLLKQQGIPILDLNSASEVMLYVDGADQVNQAKQMIKGGGGALTREKIIATVAKQFICIVDESKYVQTLGNFPIAIEVLPMARSYVARQIVKLGGDPVYRTGFTTDNGNVILDVYNLKLLNLKLLEDNLKQIVGVVESGIFAKRQADLVIVGFAQDKVEQF